MFVRSRGLFAALVLFLAVAPLQAQTKIGYVDSRKILQEMPGRQQVEAKLRTDIEALGAREKKMIDSLNVMMAAFEKDSATLAAPDRTRRFAALQQYDAQYRDTLQALQTEAQQMQAEAMQPFPAEPAILSTQIDLTVTDNGTRQNVYDTTDGIAAVES